MAKEVFYVDNDSDDLTIFLYAAKALDIQVRLFNNGEQIIQYFQKFSDTPAAIFVDLNMPKVSGYDVILEISHNSILKEIPIIAFSTTADNERVEETKKAGATCFIVKPNQISRLKKLIQFAVSTDWSAFDTDRNFVIKK